MYCIIEFTLGNDEKAWNDPPVFAYESKSTIQAAPAKKSLPPTRIAFPQDVQSSPINHPKSHQTSLLPSSSFPPPACPSTSDNNKQELLLTTTASEHDDDPNTVRLYVFKIFDETFDGVKNELQVCIFHLEVKSLVN